MSLAALSYLAMTQLSVPPGAYELAERMKRLDVAWMNCTQVGRKRDAIPNISEALAASQVSRNGEAAEFLDRAVAKLEGRQLRSSDALSIRCDSPFYEPGASVTLKLSWTYRPESVIPVRIGSGSRFIDLRPGSNGTLVVNPSESNAELRMNQEVGYLLPVRVGDDTRFVYLSFVRNYRKRVDALVRSNNSLGRVNGDLFQKYSGDTRAQELELPLIQYLFAAENIAEKKQTLADQEQIYYDVHKGTPFRAQFPRTLRGKTGEAVDVVIALQGMNYASENMFFESYGRGDAVTEAMKRRWVFISPRTSPTMVQDMLEWLTGPRGLQVNRLFLIGHSNGANVVLNEKLSTAPTAVALLAPGKATPSETIQSAPTFLAVGKQDTQTASATASNLAKLYEGRADFEFKQYDPCEHLMIGAEAIKDAYKFFDQR